MRHTQGVKRGCRWRGANGESVQSVEPEGDSRRAGRLEGDVGVSVVDPPVAPTPVEALPELDLGKRMDPVERANPQHPKEVGNLMGAVAHPEGVAPRLPVDGENPLRERVLDQVFAPSLDDRVEPEAAPGEAPGESCENDRGPAASQDRVGEKSVQQQQ